MLLRPPHIKPGDKVVILSTARFAGHDDVAPAAALLESWGLQVVLGKTIGLQQNQYAGTDEERLEDFQSALDDPLVRAIICARGGYGTVRILDRIDWTGMLSHPKWVTGFSDMTYLHIHINQSLGIQSLHSTVPALFHRNSSAAIESFREQLFGLASPFEWQGHNLDRQGNANGSLIGGNLSILYSITGTKSGFNTAGKILFIEDVDERLYHIDRMMINLKRSGKLSGLAGLLVGGLTEISDNAVPFGKTAEEIIAEHTDEFAYPVCFGFPAGHLPDNRAFVLGSQVNLTVGPVNRLV